MVQLQVSQVCAAKERPVGQGVQNVGYSAQQVSGRRVAILFVTLGGSTYIFGLVDGAVPGQCHSSGASTHIKAFLIRA